MERATIRLNIFIDGKQHGLRRWPAVPQIGQQLGVKNYKGSNHVMQVKQVVWLDQELFNECEVDVYLEEPNQ